MEKLASEAKRLSYAYDAGQCRIVSMLCAQYGVGPFKPKEDEDDGVH